MTSDLQFSLTRNGAALVSVAADGETPAGELVTLGEKQHCGFSLAGREPDTEYAVLIGDVDPSASGESGRAQAFGPLFLWPDHPYFESSRGRVWVWLKSRRIDEGGEWRRRAGLCVNVVPTKLGEARYLAMFEEIRALNAGLVFDLVSKMVRGVAYRAVPGSKPAVRSSQLELRAVELTWEAVAGALRRIESEPVGRLERRRKVRAVAGPGSLGAVGLRQLLAKGIDPRSPMAVWPIAVSQEVLVESAKTEEHRVILGFLRFLRARVARCAESAKAQIAALEAQRVDRDIAVEPGPTLYESMDRPRIERLREADEAARRLELAILRAEQVPFLRGIGPKAALPHGPVFGHVAPYRAFAQAMQNYLRSSMLWIDDRPSERIKSTSRMFEQWCFLQIATALMRVGLAADDLGGLLRERARSSFTVDLDENTILEFRGTDGTRVRLRYEPWVRPLDVARRMGETVCKGRAGAVAWKPDILLEFSERGSDQFRTDYAVVVDAKYSSAILDHHWDRTSKYAEIRSTESGKQVVRQVWLAYPGSTGVAPRDSAVSWTDSGPDRPKDESIFGTIGMLPPEKLVGEIVSYDDVDPQDAARNFVSGLLRYLGIRVDATATMPRGRVAA